MPVADWIIRWKMLEHPEGGWFVETFRASTVLDTPRGRRAASTAILYALPAGGRSAWHVVHGADEVWHHYDGGALTLHRLDAAGRYEAVLIDREHPQAVVPAGVWQAAEAEADVLVGCTVAPGFDFVDFEMAAIDTLPHVSDGSRAQIARLLKS